MTKYLTSVKLNNAKYEMYETKFIGFIWTHWDHLN